LNFVIVIVILVTSSELISVADLIDVEIDI